MKNKSIFMIVMGIGFCWLAGGGPSALARTLEDQSGRVVTVPESPARVISLAPNITEIIYALGCGDRLKGAVAHSDHPEAAKALPRVGTYVRLDVEKILALSPDLCIAVKDGNPKETVLRLESLGIPVYAVNPRSLDSVMSSVLAIGELLNASQPASALVKSMQDRILKVKRMVARADHKPKVFFQIGISPIVSAGHDTFIHELIEASGGVNLAGDQASYPRFSLEEIIVAAPDIIITTTMEQESPLDDLKNRWRAWPDLPAVRNNRIYIVNSDVFDRPAPRLIDALEMLARMIHPELPWDNPQAKASS